MTQCPSCAGIDRHTLACSRDRWNGSRPPHVRPGRPYVLQRGHHGWLVFTVEQGVVAGRLATCSEACDVARFWSVAYHGMSTEAAR